MCLVGVEKNCPGENFAAAVGARGVDGLDVAHEQSIWPHGLAALHLRP